jgi:hypothetical protein
MVALKRIQERRTAHLGRLYQKLKPDEKVFALPDGNPNDILEELSSERVRPEIVDPHFKKFSRT